MEDGAKVKCEAEEVNLEEREGRPEDGADGVKSGKNFAADFLSDDIKEGTCSSSAEWSGSGEKDKV